MLRQVTCATGKVPSKFRLPTIFRNCSLCKISRALQIEVLTLIYDDLYTVQVADLWHFVCVTLSPSLKILSVRSSVREFREAWLPRSLDLKVTSRVYTSAKENMWTLSTDFILELQARTAHTYKWESRIAMKQNCVKHNSGKTWIVAIAMDLHKHRVTGISRKFVVCVMLLTLAESIFGEDMDKSTMSCFLTHCVYMLKL